MVPVFGNLKRSGASIPSVRETDNFLLSVLPYRQILAPAQFLPVCSHLLHMLASPQECEQGEKDNGKRGSNTRQVQSCITSVHILCKDVT